MASIELLLLFTLLSGVLAYLVGSLHRVAGTIITIISSMVVFISVAYYGFSNELNITVEFLPYISLYAQQLNVFFAVIVTFVFAMVSFFNPYFIKKYKYPAAYSMLYLFALTGVIGVFFTNNFMVLFFFFEFVVWTSLFFLPMGRNLKSAVLYYGFAAAGSFALLFAILFMKEISGTYNIDVSLALLSGKDAVVIYILLAFAAFAKLGAFPLHIWLPNVLRDAPDAVSAVYSGGLEKLGAFIAVMGLLKIAPIGPTIDAIALPFANLIIALLGSITIVIGTLMAIRQDDAKTLLAYSSMSNGGYILVALSLLSNAGIAGGLYHVLAHAIASTAAFLAIAAVARQTKTTKMSELGGMIHKMPITYLVYLIAIISMAGIPPMGGFISKWLIFQAVIDKGMIFVAIATFFGSIGSFLYVFRPLAALFLGQELPEHKNYVKEAPILMIIPLLILSGLNIYTGVLPNTILRFINKILNELSFTELELGGYTIVGFNGTLHPALISIVFGVGVLVAFLIFITLKKSKKVDLMDTYTAGNFVYTEELLHYSLDFYAPLERMYENHTTKFISFYKSLGNKVKELGRLAKYYLFSDKPEGSVFWITVIIVIALWGGIL